MARGQVPGIGAGLTCGHGLISIYILNKKAAPNPCSLKRGVGCGSFLAAGMAARKLLDPRGPALGFVLDDHPFQQLADDGLLRLRHAGDGLELQGQVGVWRQFALLAKTPARN